MLGHDDLRSARILQRALHPAPRWSFIEGMPSYVDLEELSSIGDAEFVREMIELFQTVGAQNLQDVRVALDREDALMLRSASHKLRGACLGLACTVMAEIAGQVETVARKGEVGPARPLVVTLEDAFGLTLAELSALRLE
jgi:HPt (histidine-containing phosphotransfer) domain-containing protein